jgi:acetyl esterase
MPDLDALLHARPDPAVPMDPQLKAFVTRMAADASKYPRRDTVSIAEGREIAEKVRAPWVVGGPIMASTVEHEVPTRHGSVSIRVYTPNERRLPGAFFYIHGGGFVLFSMNTHDRVMREYAERAGMLVIGIDYTRAPEAQFPQPLEECVDTVQWLHAHADTLGFDASQLFIGGDSAGGNLSLGTCVSLRDLGHPVVAGMVLNYGGYSNHPYTPSVVKYGAGDYGLSLHMMIWFYLLYLKKEDFANPLMDLVNADLHGLPPVCMVITECDTLYDDNLRMAQLLKDAGNQVTDTVYPGTVHSFLEAVSIADVAVKAFDDTARWLEKTSNAR